jgi:hypothetical protein
VSVAIRAQPGRELLMARASSLVGRIRRAPFVFGAALALVVGLGTGAAYGYFSASGSGNGTASVGVGLSVTMVAATATPTSKLQPGSSASLTLTLTNPNNRPVTVVAISQNGTPTITGGVGCTATVAEVTVPTKTGLSYTVAHGSHAIQIATGAMMGSASASGCQGASFHFHVDLTVHL